MQTISAPSMGMAAVRLALLAAVAAAAVVAARVDGDAGLTSQPLLGMVHTLTDPACLQRRVQCSSLASIGPDGATGRSHPRAPPSNPPAALACDPP